jgi:hypothetical protein
MPQQSALLCGAYSLTNKPTMLNLNLTDESTKREIKYQKIFHLLLKGELVLLFIIFGTGVIFIAASSIVSNNLSRISDTIIKSSQNNSTYAARANEIKKQIAIVKDIQSSYLPASRLINDVATIIPENISLSYLGIGASDKTIKIRGLASTRDDLLSLENKLKETSWLSNINIPLEEKLIKTNIDFDIDFNFDPSRIP